MARIFFMRHGRPEFPGGKTVCLGSTELPLSKAGQEQAECAAREFEGKHLTVYSSPQIRALETAAAFGRPIRILEDLRERHMGIWDGLSFDQIKLLYPELYEARRENSSLAPPGAEPEEMVRLRFTSAMDQVRRECVEDALIVTHSSLMQLCLGIEKPSYCQIVELSL